MSDHEDPDAPVEVSLAAHLFRELDLRRRHALSGLAELKITLRPTPTESSSTGSADRSTYVGELWEAARTAIDKQTALKKRERQAADLAAHHLLGVSLALRGWEEAVALSSPETLAAAMLASIRLGEIGAPQTKLVRVLRQPKPATRGVGRPKGPGYWEEDEETLLRFFILVLEEERSESGAWDEICGTRESGDLSKRKRLQERLAGFLPSKHTKANNRGPLLGPRRSALKSARQVMSERAFRRQGLAIQPK